MSASSVSMKPQAKEVTQLIKIALPHLGLYGLIFVYLMVGAWIFRRLEISAELVQQQERLNEIEEVYKRILYALRKECPNASDEKVYTSLSRLSSFMEGKTFLLSPYKTPDVTKLFPTKWDLMSSIFYALSILTTTGYGFVSPITNAGKYFSMAYGFIGIPLMFLAAVDIGHFLSDVVLRFYEQTQKKKAKWCGCGRNKSVIAQVETKALKVLTPKRKSISEKIKSTKKKDNPKKKRLPLSVNFSILLLFCMCGGLVYIAAGGKEKNFIGAFFVTFNLVANLTMSEMPMDLSRLLTVLYITIFVMFGLAVLSMCAELAAVQLKSIFFKLHYFGRKINWKRRSRTDKKEQMEVEVKELLKIIDQIRAKYPEKQEITSVDILKYVQELNGGNDFVTLNMFIRQHRRDTIAFMPQSIEALKFADDMEELEDTNSRSIKEEDELVSPSTQDDIDFTAMPYYI
ncbi:Uncoordinated protein 58 [Aphelenchoides besseyi]|nr:Uncoordinated protein 58 [Aphelenchoides besseyi]